MEVFQVNTGIISNDSMATMKSPIVPSVIVASYATILALAPVVLDGGTFSTPSP